MSFFFTDQNGNFGNGLITIAANGDPAAQTGVAIHIYAANTAMQGRFFYTADGELFWGNDRLEAALAWAVR